MSPPSTDLVAHDSKEGMHIYETGKMNQKKKKLAFLAATGESNIS
jgi:Cu/Zn superoxide dismutase